MKGMAEIELVGNVVRIRVNEALSKAAGVCYDVNIAVNRPINAKGGWIERTDWYNCVWFRPPKGIFDRLEAGDPVRVRATVTQVRAKKKTFYNFAITMLFPLPRWKDPKSVEEAAEAETSDESDDPFGPF